MSGAQPRPFPPIWASEWGLDHRSAFPFVCLDLGKGILMRLRWIPAGRFLMGSPEDEQGCFDDESPRHWVTLTRGFWLGEVPCTQTQWEAVMGNNPSEFKGTERPVEQVTWDECQEYRSRLSERNPGLVVRLPTEAEWEYACRAGSESAYNDGSACTAPQGHDPALERLGWFDKNSGDDTHPVGKKLPNAWGLYDMHGNVWEWCSDWMDEYASDEQTDPSGPREGRGRVIRGGGWDDWARSCRSAVRDGDEPGGRWDLQGFRLLAVQSGEPGERSDREGEEASSG